MSEVPHPSVLACPLDPAFECRWIGDALPPDGTLPVRDTENRCPAGYLPHRLRPPPALQGKLVVTSRPAEQRLASSGNDSTEPAKPPGPK